MANYSLVINSRFAPFSYQEMLAPVMMATQAHQDLENQYGELEAKASLWERLANEQPDSKAYTMYKTYANDLREQADQLAREGLNATSRRSALNMRSRYSKEIVPIEQAYATRLKQAEQQQQARLQDPTLMFNRKAATTSLDRYLENPLLDYESYSGALITKRIADAVKNYSDTLLRTGEWQSTAFGQLLERMQQTGLTREDIQMIIDNPNYFPEIQDLINNVVETSVGNWGDKDLISDALSYAREGLFSGLGKQTIDVQKNASYLNPYEQWKWNKEIEESKSTKDGLGEGIYFPNIEIGTTSSQYNTFNPNNLKMTNEGTITSSEIEDLDKQIQDLHEKKKALSGDPTSDSYRRAIGYTLSKQQVDAHTMSMYSTQLKGLEAGLTKLEKQLKNEKDPSRKIEIENKIRLQEDLILNKEDQMRGFADNAKLRTNYSSVIAKLEAKKRSIQRDIDKYSKKYEHLSDDPIRAMQLGISIDNQTSLSSTRANQVSFGEDDKSSENMLNSLLKSARASTTTNVYKVDDTGKPTYEQVEKGDLPENAEGLTLLYSDYGLMYSDEEGNKYSIKSDDYSSKIAKEAEVVRNHLTDFSKDNMKNAILLEEGNIVKNGVLYNKQELADLLIKSRVGKRDPNTNTISATLKQLNGDIINVVVYDIDSEQPKVVYSSMYDLENGGTSFSDNKNKYRQFRGAELIGTYVNRKPSASLSSGESYTVN